MRQTGFGHRGSYSCMYATHDSGDYERAEVYYPPPGYLPIAAFDGTWSFMAKDLEIPDSAQVSITDTGTDQPVPVENVRLAPGNYAGMATLAWDVPDLLAGATYRVQITGLGANGTETRTYETSLIKCD